MSKITLIKFGATRCGPCKMMQPILDKFKEDYKEVNYIEYDIEVDEDKTIEYSVRSIPYIVIEKDGEITDTRTGVADLDKLRELVL